MIVFVRGDDEERVLLGDAVRGKPRKEFGTEVITLEKTAGVWQSNSFAWFSKGTFEVLVVGR